MQTTDRVQHVNCRNAGWLALVPAARNVLRSLLTASMLTWPYVSYVDVNWHQLLTKEEKQKQNNGLLQQKKQAIELTHEWIVNFDLNSLLHT